MKTFCLLLLSVSMPVFVVTTSYARDPSSKAGQAVWATALERFDLNQNNTIEVEELAVRLQQFAQQTDADHDGNISPQELHNAARQLRQIAGDRLRIAAQQARSGKISVADLERSVHQVLQKADADHNGELTREEARRAVHAAVEGARERVAEHHKQHAEALAAAIAQRQAEIGAALTAVAERIENAHPEKPIVAAAIRALDSNGDNQVQRKELQARAEQLFSVADADHDGALSDQELQKATAEAARVVRQRLEDQFAKMIQNATAR